MACDGHVRRIDAAEAGHAIGIAPCTSVSYRTQAQPLVCYVVEVAVHDA